jgi:hypothetical protein
MLNRRALALAAGLSVLPQGVRAAEDAARCVAVSEPKRIIKAQHGKWIEPKSDQWQFLRGIYAMNPTTPLGLPYGDKAALATFDGQDGGVVFFLDGDRASTPMIAPVALHSMMDDVATATISHEGNAF